MRLIEKACGVGTPLQGSVAEDDIEALIHLVQTKVYKQTSIELMREVHIIGDC